MRIESTSPAGRAREPRLSIVDHRYEAVVSIDADGVVLGWNRMAESTFGWPVEEALGVALEELLVPVRSEELLVPVRSGDAHGRGFRQFLEAEAGGVVGRRLEFEALHRDGHELPVELTFASAEVGGVTVFHAFLHDISGRRRAEEATRLLAGIVESSDDAIVGRDLDGTVRSWNAGAERLLGYSAEEMIGCSTERLWREDLAGFEAMQEALAVGRPIPTFDARLVHADGCVIEAAVTSSALKDDDGRVLGVSVMFRGILDRRVAERDSRLLAALVADSEDAIMASSLDGTVMSWNPAAERLYGYTAGEMVGQSVTKVRPDRSPEDACVVHAALAAGERIPAFETQETRKDGSLVEVSVSLSAVRDAPGHVVGVSAIARDISARKHAERDAWEALRRFENAFENAPIGMALVALDGRWLAVNESLCELLGRSEPALRGTTFQSITHPEDLDADLDLVEQTLAGEIDRYRLDKRYRLPGGEVVWASLSVSLVRDSEGEPLHFIAQLQDITERTKAEDELRAYGEHLDHLARQDPATDRRDLRDFDVMLDSELERGRRYGGCWSVVLFQAHPVGIPDVEVALLDAVGVVIEQARRTSDLAARIGVGEFGLILPQTTGADARRTAQRIADEVRSRTGAPPLCFGIGSWPEDGDSKELVLAAAEGQRRASRSEGPTAAVTVGAMLARRPDAREGPARLRNADDVEQHEAVARRSEIELAGISALLSALTARDHYTGEHSVTVVTWAARVARQLGLDSQQLLEIEQVALLHDIGKIGIPDSVLFKRGPLNDQEWELMHQHPAIGARILAGTETLAYLAPAIKAEHERFDGDGYPDGLRGEEIPLASRITFACDAYHAMTSDRPYRSALPAEHARAELRANVGTQFDPTVVEALLAVV